MVNPTFQLLLVSVESLARQIDCRLCGLHGNAVLLHIKLGIADLDPNLIFQLMLTYLGLPIFEFSADLVRLC